LVIVRRLAFPLLAIAIAIAIAVRMVRGLATVDVATFSTVLTSSELWTL